MALSSGVPAAAPADHGSGRIDPEAVHEPLTVAAYYRDVRAGVWGDRVPELLDGVLADIMPPPDPWHTAVVYHLMAMLQEMLPTGWCLRKEDGLTLPRSVVMPDLAIVRGDYLDYTDANPTPADVSLVVEVAQTSQRRDREKATLYAVAGIATYLLVDLSSRELIVHTGPSAAGYDDVGLREAVSIAIGDTPCGTLQSKAIFAPIR